MSLFRYLSEHHPSALVSLREQYRMNRYASTLEQCSHYAVCIITLWYMFVQGDHESIQYIDL